MIRIFLITLIGTILFSACKKDEEKSMEYWDKLVQDKVVELNKLADGVTCTRIEEFEVISGRYQNFVNHPSIDQKLKKLLAELDILERKQEEARFKKGIIIDYMPPTPYIRLQCVDNKVKIVYPKDLPLEEVKTEHAIKLAALKDFYKDTSCNDSNNWDVVFVNNKCERIPIAFHKSLRGLEFQNLYSLFYLLDYEWRQRENISCDTKVEPPRVVKCVDGKAVVEFL